ncbi:unnamed protein product [Echinostoma caproni]|uniref:Ceramidse_alk_C domain-containing protein n=1 Tax=Echinostoma caproni TaxID=27848 RepID=A0A183AAZ1_9TREM|nr:unnamed protein product [Echinostoma caproni]
MHGGRGPVPNATVHVEFVSANPRNDVRLNDTYLTVEYLDETTNQWIVRFTDADWETKFHWTRVGALQFILGQSKAMISWQVRRLDGTCEPGHYRIRHFGAAKPLFRSTLEPFEGLSREFLVTCGN